jgi:hypothetical protein
MVSKLGKAIVWALMLTLVTTSMVYAADEPDHERIQRVGEITSVDLEASCIVLQSRNGESIEFFITESTNYRSRNDVIQGIADLSIGMKALVTGEQEREGHFIALLIMAGLPDEVPELQRVTGFFVSINADAGIFQLEKKNGEVQEFVAANRTHYKSRDGSISGLADIEPGMVAVVVALVRTDQTPLALWVGVGRKPEQRERFMVIGEIGKVVPGQNTFELIDSSGNTHTFSVIERTRFRSRDGSLLELQDLKKGMHALVLGVREDDGSQVALVIAAGYLEDLKQLPRGDLRAMGKITSIGDQFFTIESRYRGVLTFLVDDSTIYKSRSGNIDDIDDLQVGMNIVVVAEGVENGTFKAIMIGVGLSLHRDVLPDSQESLR